MSEDAAVRKAGLLLPVLRNSAESWGDHHCAGELRRAIKLIEDLIAVPASAVGGSGISIGTEIEGIPWTEEMEDTFNKTIPKVRELVGLDSPSVSIVVAYMVDGMVEQGLFFDKSAAEVMALANCGVVVPLIRKEST